MQATSPEPAAGGSSQVGTLHAQEGAGGGKGVGLGWRVRRACTEAAPGHQVHEPAGERPGHAMDPAQKSGRGRRQGAPRRRHCSDSAHSLQIALQAAFRAKLLPFGSAPPHWNCRHLAWLASKYQRGMAALPGPALSGSRQRRQGSGLSWARLQRREQGRCAVDVGVVVVLYMCGWLWNGEWGQVGAAAVRGG